MVPIQSSEQFGAVELPDFRSKRSETRRSLRSATQLDLDTTNMAYRGVKGSDPFVSKTSRNERFAQMSKQEQIIEQKKLEIQAKMQEQKAKEAVENLRKTNTVVPNSVTNKVNFTK